MKTKLKSTYEDRWDSFRNIYILIACIPLGYFTRPRKGLEWAFFSYSLWVEVVAILPQLILLNRRKGNQRFDALTVEYIFFLSIYRLFYLLNWAHKLITRTGYTPHVLWMTGICQTLVYSDFIYVYLKAKIKGTDIELPGGYDYNNN
jgi:ER lumen protein retaining receptor